MSAGEVPLWICMYVLEQQKMNDPNKLTNLRVYPDWLMQSAEAALGLIESDFGQSGRDVRLEAIRCELFEAFRRGAAVEPTRDPDDAPDATQKFAGLVQDAKRYRCLRDSGAYIPGRYNIWALAVGVHEPSASDAKALDVAVDQALALNRT